MNDQTIENLFRNEWSNYRELVRIEWSNYRDRIQNWMIKL